MNMQESEKKTLLCPYLEKSQTVLQMWDQNSDENQILTDGKTVTRTEYEYMECQKDNCAVFYGGRCHYKD